MATRVALLVACVATSSCGGPNKDKIPQADKDANASYTNVRHRQQSASDDQVKKKGGKSAWQTEFDKAQQSGGRR